MRIRAWVVGMVLAVVIGSVSWPLLRPEFFFVHDYVHAARIGEVWRGVSVGHIPVRWSQYFGFGYGMPLFEFYAPLPYYFGAIWYAIGLPVVIAVKLVFLTATVLAVGGAYLAGQAFGGKRAGLVAAVLFGVAPYRAVNLFVRGAVSESWAMAFFPWITWGIMLVVKRKKWGWLVLTASLVGLLLSHNLSSLMFVPLSVVFGGAALLLSHGRRQLQAWVELVGAYILSVGLAAYYLFPAFLEKDLTQIGLIVGGYFDYRLHFVYIRQLITPYWGYGGSTWGVDDGLSFFVGYGVLVGILAAIVGMAILLWQKRKKAVPELSQLILVFVLGAIALLMSIGKSEVIWNHVPLLSFIQFPWRWLAAAGWWLALAIGYGVSFIPHRLGWVVVTAVLMITLGTQVSYYQPERYLDTAESLYYTTPDRIAKDMSKVLMDYVPQGFDYTWAENAPLLPGAILVTPDINHQLQIDQPHHRRIQVNIEQPSMIEVGLASFPGWQVKLDEQPIVASRSAKGLIQVAIPAGTHVLDMQFGSTPIRTISDTVSSMTWFGLGVMMIYRVLSSRKLHLNKVQPNDAKNSRTSHRR